jgi:hypothetical protein
MSDPSDTFLREVQEEYRRDRAAQLFNKYGTLALGGAIAILALVAGYVWYTAYTTSVAEKAGGRFTAAQRLLQSEKAEDQETALKDFREIAQGDSKSYAVLAKLQLAGQHLQDDKIDEARSLFQEVRSDGDADEKLRSFANLQLATIESSELDFDALKARLGDLTADESIWRFSARELLAMKAVETNKLDDARQVLAELLGAAEAPQSIRERAQMMMSLITVRETPTTPRQPAAEDAKRSDAGNAAKDDTKKPETSGN